MANEYLPIPWNTYHDLTQKLAATVLSCNLNLDEIVAISRGGLTLGHLLSDYLKIPVCTFTIQSYKDIQKQGEMEIAEPLSRPIKNKNILLVDDVSDTGKTLKRAISYLNHFKPKKIILLTMFYKPKSEVRPDFFAKTTSKWIIFPYEVTETINSISEMMTKQGKSKKQIQDKLESLDFTIDQIAFVRKYYLSKI